METQAHTPSLHIFLMCNQFITYVSEENHQFEENDQIEIDIPNRTINLMINDEALTQRKNKMNAKGKSAWKPKPRTRKVSQALRAYALMATSADKGAIRDISKLEEI